MQNLEDIFAFLESGLPPHPDAGLFGASIPSQLAGIHIIGVPWDATTSYGRGTWQAPDAIRRASHQLDLMDLQFGRVFRRGISLINLESLSELNAQTGQLAQQIIAACENGLLPDPNILALVNQASEQTNAAVYTQALNSLKAGKLVGLLGGDHSTSFGLIRAIAEHHESFGILHIDAHHDLRQAYEGFTHSHASIFYNVLQSYPQVERLVSAGIRDFCSTERAFARTQGSRIQIFYDEQLFERKAQAQPFLQIANELLAPLPSKIYISLDIDGLAQPFCPNTGTPVPGGFSFQEIVYLLHHLAKSGRTLIGFDLVEVVPGEDEWDANVGARLLYKLCGLLAHTNP
jgi:agmatinase